MRKATALAAMLLASSALIGGCDQVKQVVTGQSEVKEAAYPERVYWGDTHLHTANSPDAFGFGNRLEPEAALRFAKGEEVVSSTGVKAKLARPLDFLVIADHSDGFASIKDLYNAPRSFITHPLMLRWYDMMHESPEQSIKAVGEIIDAKAKNNLPPELLNPEGAAERLKNNWRAQSPGTKDEEGHCDGSDHQGFGGAGDFGLHRLDGLCLSGRSHSQSG